MNTSGLTMKSCPGGGHSQLTPPLLHLSYPVYIQPSYAKPSFFRSHLPGLRLGLVANAQWKVWWRSSGAHPCCPRRHSVCSEAQLSMCPPLAPGEEDESNSWLCLQYTILYSLHPDNALGWPAEVGDVTKVSVFSCKIPVSQLDSRNMNIYGSTLKYVKLYHLILYHNKV